MNLYHCMVELKNPDRSLAFAKAADAWLGHLLEQEMILSWRIMRRKFGLSSSPHTDFLIEIEIEGMAALDETFKKLAQMDVEYTQRYEQMNAMIASMKIGLYRPYPDPEQRERISLL